jgi:hypothetical protein
VARERVYNVKVNRATQTATSDCSPRASIFAFQKYLSESDVLMAMNDVTHLRYIGVIPQIDCLEYGFRIEDKDKEPRLIILVIESELFRKHALMFQEAPDLCYQKLLAELKNETTDLPIYPRLSITASDIASYRELHPIGRSAKQLHKNLQQ